MVKYKYYFCHSLLISWLYAFLLLAVITGCSDDTNETTEEGIVPIEVSSPQAEYDPANIILMHTPGNEMEGAYGRTKYFDV